jgi:hypothetical protein
LHTVLVSSTASGLYVQPPALMQQLCITCLSRTVSFEIAAGDGWALDLLVSSRWDEASGGAGGVNNVTGVVFGTLLDPRTAASSPGGSLDGDAVQWISEVSDEIWMLHTSWQRGPRQW